MIKILFYELKRQFSSFFFWSSLGIMVLYSLQIFVTDIIRGVSYTAPFSGWSYGFFLSKMMIFLCIIYFFMVAKNFSKKEQEKTKLIYFKNRNTRRYPIVKIFAVIVSIAFIFVMIFSLSFLLLFSIFHFDEFHVFIPTIILSSIPIIFFMGGVYYLLFTLNTRLAYIITLLFYSMEMIYSKNKLDFFGTYFFEHTPLTFSETPDFFIPSSFIYTRLMIFILGLIAFIIAYVISNKKFD